ALVAATMALGGVLGARRVAETMGRRITDMSPGQGLTGNLVTGVLVLGASRAGLPVSTTHVSCGAIFGIGATTGRADRRVIGEILLAWLATLPLGAACAAGLYLALTR
ncbi:MAG: inorganic phosphate transporter, partial [Candidatus Methylomirabilis sp.]|nr:inorganic phosphate transporter [Deltaproteobacteria bacterium]